MSLTNHYATLSGFVKSFRLSWANEFPMLAVAVHRIAAVPYSSFVNPGATPQQQAQHKAKFDESNAAFGDRMAQGQSAQQVCANNATLLKVAAKSGMTVDAMLAMLAQPQPYTPNAGGSHTGW